MCICLSLIENLIVCVLVFDSVSVFEHEVGLGSLRVSVFFGYMSFCERGCVCVCVCVCVCSTVLFGERE